ncbi:MAG: hypothetical protein HZA62_16440 [Rhodocyclales bacterium]|nr:hypothetical protein [Rhodocyclales bacterium]
MLGFFSSKTEHPLADAKEAKRILGEIATREPVGAAEEASGWLESIPAEQGFKPAQRLDLILRLDEATAAQSRRLARDYQPLVNGSRAQESRHWDLSHGYWMLLLKAYLDCFVRLRAGDRDADAMRPQQHLLFSRLINAAAAELKWRQFHYGPVDGETWRTLGSVYLAAAEARLDRRPLVFYPGGNETTVEAEYLKALIFHASAMDNLKPLQIEIAERFIGYFLPFFALARELQADSVYWVDAAKALPPTRLARKPDVTSTLRFFSGTRAVNAVTKTIEQIKVEHRVPATINLGAQYEPDAVVPVLEHLALNWAPKPPLRNTARRRINSPLKLVSGMNSVHQRLSGRAQNGEGMESWVIDDVSLGGMGAHAAQARRDWIRIGVMVAVQPDGGDNWLLGVVRRYVRTGPNEDSIGIETISKSPRAVLADAGGIYTEALLLDVPEVGEYARMALPANALEDKVALVFKIDDKNARLHPREVLTTGPDFVVANFFVQSYS